MAAKPQASKIARHARDESGQSVLEFLILLPLMLGLTVLTVRMNMAIQVSIVNQQYSRAQALQLAFHSPNYPELKYQREGNNQLILGVSENMPDADGASYYPEATVSIVARNRRLANRPGGEQEQPNERSHVRIRNTVTLCTPSNSIQTSDGWTMAGGDGLREGITPQSFAYCRGSLE